MLVKEIIEIRKKLVPFKVDLPLESPKLTLPFSPSLDQIFETFNAFNIPYDKLSIQEMQSVVKLMQQRLRKDTCSIIVLQALSSHLKELEDWTLESI